MYYRVTAKLKPETARDFLRKLTDGTIQSQRPDGGEIVESMNRAVQAEDGNTVLSIACHCHTPLAHERVTVLNHHFDDLQTELIEGYQNFDGQPFMEHLSMLAQSQGQIPDNQPEPFWEIPNV